MPESPLDIGIGRLVDYLAVVGFDRDRERNGISVGRVLQRFPTRDWAGLPFFQGLELFCRPLGWQVVRQPDPPQPSYHISVLTDVDAGQHYAAVLTAWLPHERERSLGVPMDDDDFDVDETFATPPSNIDEAATNGHDLVVSPDEYVPLCFVVVSRHDQLEIFRHILCTLYTVIVDKINVEVESVVASMIAAIRVPPPGSKAVQLTLGAGDRLILQQPFNLSIPVTSDCVLRLCEQLGIHNVLQMFNAVVTERKILFFSQSFSRLVQASRALLSLMYPLKFSHVYVPVLPCSLLEVLCTPTPFVMGAHSSLKAETDEYVQNECITVDCDTGHVIIPEQVVLPPMPAFAQQRLVSSLTLVLHRDLSTADLAFQSPHHTAHPPSAEQPLHASRKDKQIRACFLRFFVDLLADYRLCLQIIRLYPTPFVTFHKSAFCGLRGLADNDFIHRLLDSMAFEQFVQQRGVPYRFCDLFDELYANVHSYDDSFNLTEQSEQALVLAQRLQDLGEKLYENECPSRNQQSRYAEKLIRPSLDQTQNLLPLNLHFNAQRVQELIDSMTARLEQRESDASSPTSLLSKDFVPAVPSSVPTGLVPRQVTELGDPHARRLDVMRTCMKFIFENKVSEARRMMNAVLISLKRPSVRVMFCRQLRMELHSRGSNRTTVMEPAQFDLICKLMNAALQADTAEDEYGVAHDLLTRSSYISRKLGAHSGIGIEQLAYTCIQEHPVWLEQSFWQSSFFNDVQSQMCSMYRAVGSPARRASSEAQLQEPLLISTGRDLWNLSDQPATLKTFAKQLQLSPPGQMESNRVTELSDQEISMLVAQAVYYIHCMAWTLVPPDMTKLKKINVELLERCGDNADGRNTVARSRRSEDTASVSSNVTADSDDSSVAESGFAGGHGRQNAAGPLNDLVDVGGDEVDDPAAPTVTFIRKFVDRVLTQAGVPLVMVQQLHHRIPVEVAMQVETLRNVHRESKKLPAIQRPQMPVPQFAPGEQAIQSYLRVYLLCDGRQEFLKANDDARKLLPAEGAIFITNYRVIFKGYPLDQFLSEQVVVRSMPLMAVTKDKSIGSQQLEANVSERQTVNLHHGMQIRSATFQLLKFAFDEEVMQDRIEAFTLSLNSARWPEDLSGVYALSNDRSKALTLQCKDKAVGDGKGTIKHARRFVGKKILRTAERAGLRGHSSSTVAKRRGSGSKTLPNSAANRASTASGTMPPPRPPPPMARTEDDMGSSRGSQDSYNEDDRTLTRTLGISGNRSDIRDYQRLALCTYAEVSADRTGLHCTGHLRLTSSNRSYVLCRTYPAVVIVPTGCSDEALRKVAKCHKQGRLPVVTWASNRGALLLRGAGFNLKVFVGKIKGTFHIQPVAAPAGSAVMASRVEHERFFVQIAQMSPNEGSTLAGSQYGSDESLDSLLNPLVAFRTDTSSGSLLDGAPPEFQRATHHRMSASGKVFQYAFNTLRPGSTSNSTTSGASSSPKRSPLTYAQKRMSAMHMGTGIPKVQTQLGAPVALDPLRRADLYVLCDTNYVKSLRSEASIEFINIDFVDAKASKAAMKKLLRLCVPSAIQGASSGGTSGDPATSSVFLKQLDSTGWMQQIQQLLRTANHVAYLLGDLNASVAVCLEDGWDATAQVVSLTELLLDSHYRSIEGFCTLVDKEWLSFGHRFSHRANHTSASKLSGNAPVFLQFLDACHQLLRQFPSAFEFNDFFLRYLAYHSLSCYFRTFLLDCEAERDELGLLYANDRKSSVIDDDPTSIWDHIQQRSSQSAIFTNLSYAPQLYVSTLTATTSIAALDLWEYYCEDSLACGSPYDLDIAKEELLERQSQATQSADMMASFGTLHSNRTIINACYNASAMQATALGRAGIAELIDEITSLEQDLNGQSPPSWFSVFHDARELVETSLDSLSDPTSHDAMARWLRRARQKRTTVEFLLRGTKAGSAVAALSAADAASASGGPAHAFEKHQFATPTTSCDYCGQILWGVVSKGYQCTQCHFNCHEKCKPLVVSACSARSVQSNVASSNGGGSHQRSGQHLPRTRTECNEYEGYLWKRGKRLRAWKQRWFVLDSLTHELRYYETTDDDTPRDSIPLRDVLAVVQTGPQPGAPKRNGGFFELRTGKRSYYFMADNTNTANQWIEKLQQRII